MKPLLDAKCFVSDISILGSVDQAAVESYLRENGWSFRQTFDPPHLGANLWEKPDHCDDPDCGHFQILTTNSRAKDHALRVADMLSIVSEADGVPVLRLLVRFVPGMPLS